MNMYFILGFSSYEFTVFGDLQINKWHHLKILWWQLVNFKFLDLVITYL